MMTGTIICKTMLKRRATGIHQTPIRLILSFIFSLISVITQSFVFFLSQKVEWYYPPNGGTRVRIHYCGNCEYETMKRSMLVNHVERMHPSSGMHPPGRVKATVYQCTECEFETKEIILFERHRKSHDEKSAFKCPWCSYSVNRSLDLTNHTKKHHTKIDKTKVALFFNKNPVYFILFIFYNHLYQFSLIGAG